MEQKHYVMVLISVTKIKEALIMIKNKAAKALIISTCLMVSSMAGVYADTSNVEVKPAIIQAVYDDSKMMETQIMPAISDDALSKKQMEIDQYVFEQHKEEIEKMGFVVTSTGVAGSVVEVSITPYDVKSADYLYGLFGKELVSVVDGEQAVIFEYGPMTGDIAAQSGVAAQKEASIFTAFFTSIVEWFKSIF
jgi:hypothetical protein